MRHSVSTWPHPDETYAREMAADAERVGCSPAEVREAYEEALRDARFLGPDHPDVAAATARYAGRFR